MTAKEKKILESMYRSLEALPGVIRKDGQAGIVSPHRNYEDVAHGAERARVLVYTWLRDLGFPPGGR
jgi:hypothetical protein